MITRPTSKQLDEKRHIVRYKGADYLLDEIAPGTWEVRGRGSVGPIATVVEKYGFGKEEAIDWLETNC